MVPKKPTIDLTKLCSEEGALLHLEGLYLRASVLQDDSSLREIENTIKAAEKRGIISYPVAQEEIKKYETLKTEVEKIIDSTQ